ncbi:TatA/E family twin arginine-targeting protein translocase [bacterium]|jgi:sec-independent protein translocase protein TatA|nr:TatA/E family twin arginine-targeting protein translocase [bacterium]
MFGLGMMEITVILILALLVFGPKRLPEIGRGLGQGLKEFRKVGSEFSKGIMDESERLEDNTQKPQDTKESDQTK